MGFAIKSIKGKNEDFFYHFKKMFDDLIIYYKKHKQLDIGQTYLVSKLIVYVTSDSAVDWANMFFFIQVFPKLFKI